MKYTLGIDLGSSSVKASILDAQSGRCCGAAFAPRQEMAIHAPGEGMAEQNPADWYANARSAISTAIAQAGIDGTKIKAIGIAYQMHGLVLIDKQQQVLRPAIIWCDSRGVPYGNEAFARIGEAECLSTLLNSPGNFTASKLAWVKQHEPELFARIDTILLPGDWLAMQLTGAAATTDGGLSEGMFWDFSRECPSAEVLAHFGFSPEILAERVPAIGYQGGLSKRAAQDLGLAEGTPVCYRAGDQPNNAMSLNVLEPGEFAATAGTSGVIYGVSSRKVADPRSRINRFLHVNHSPAAPRIGQLLCVNGTGILNSWMRTVLGVSSYEEMNRLASLAPVGSGGVSILPFGNGAERMLDNRCPGAQIRGIDLLRHGKGELCRAAQEGIAFALAYGLEQMQGSGEPCRCIHAGQANMFLSELFGQTLADCTNTEIVLFETDGALGAARAAAVGAGIYSSLREAVAGMTQLRRIVPKPSAACTAAFTAWKNCLQEVMDGINR